MAVRRKLNIPEYEVTGEVDEDGFLVAEKVQPAEDERQERPRWRFAVHEDSPRAERERQQRAQQAAEEALRAQAQAGDPLAKLRLDAREAAMGLMCAVARSKVLDEDPQTQVERLTGWQSAYAHMMVMRCLAPLSRGMSASSVLQVVGTSTMLWMCSPVFRVQVGDQLQSVYDAVNSRIDSMQQRRLDKARRREADAIDRGWDRSAIAAKYRRRLERAERNERGGLPPFTPESAALMEVGLAELTYAEMRRPGADVKAIQARHKAVLGRLYELAANDGVESSEISAHMRAIVAMRMQLEPGFAAVFGELAHGKYALDGQGAFVETATGEKVTQGSFRVRVPQTVEQHQQAFKDVLKQNFSTALVAGPEEVETQLYLAAVGMMTHRYPEVAEIVEDPTLRAQLRQARAMIQAMHNDGIDPETAHQAHLSAISQTLSEIAESSPQFNAAWNGPTGAEWRANLSTGLSRFEEYVREVMEARENQAASSSPEHDDLSDETPTYAEENIVDAEIVEDEPAVFNVVPDLSDAQDERDVARAYFETMSDTMSQDILGELFRHADQDPAGATWLARAVWSNPQAANEPGGLFAPDGLLGGDEDVAERVKTMVTMREQLVRIGMPAAQRDQLYAASYVRALEKVVAASPAYEHVLSAMAASSGVGWREAEYARVLASTDTTRTSAESYWAYTSSIGAESRDAAVEVNDDVPWELKVHAARVSFVESMPPSIREHRFSPEKRAQAVERERQVKRRSFLRGVINREQNADYKNGEMIDLDPGMQIQIHE